MIVVESESEQTREFRPAVRKLIPNQDQIPETQTIDLTVLSDLNIDTQ